MTTRNITLQNATYYDVPAVDLPIDGGGTATFTEITDTTATAGDVLEGSYFYTSAGVKTLGTLSQGGANIGITTAQPTGTNDGSKTLAFTSLLGEPIAFFVFWTPSGTNTTAQPYVSDTSHYAITEFCYDGTEISVNIVTRNNSNYPFRMRGNGYSAANPTRYTFTYSSGTLTLTVPGRTSSNGGWYNVSGCNYKLVYIY